MDGGAKEQRNEGEEYLSTIYVTIEKIARDTSASVCASRTLITTANQTKSVYVSTVTGTTATWLHYYRYLI